MGIRKIRHYNIAFFSLARHPRTTAPEESTLITFVTGIYSFPLIFLWFICQNVSNN